MSQKLPHKDFKWVDIGGVTLYDPEGEKGYIVECDLLYPEELHEEHNAYPLAPERVAVNDEMLSPYALAMKQDLGMKGATVEKLVPNLRGKKKYIIHYRTLQFYLAHGMRLERIYRALEFTQTAFMEPFIRKNTELRKATDIPFEKDLHKLMNNSCYGKTMENVRKYKDIKLVTTPDQFQKLAKNPRYIRRTTFTEDLVAVHMQKKVVCLDKPIYIGFSVLDLSKLLMYRFHYDHMMVKYGPQRAQLLFTDTDSLCYSVKTEDLYKDMGEDSELYDFSDYPKSHPLHSDANKKVIGKMKDETKGVPIQEFVGLRAKMYSILCPGDEKKTAKGVKSSTLSRSFYAIRITAGCFVRARSFETK
jgi:hypothetical protein